MAAKDRLVKALIIVAVTIIALGVLIGAFAMG